MFRNNIRSLFLGSFYVVILSFRYFMKQKYFFKSGPPTWDGMGYNRAFWIILVQQFWNLTHRLAWKRVIFKDAGEDQIDGIDHESVPLAVSRVTCSILSCLLDCQLSSSCGAPHRTIPAAAASQEIKPTHIEKARPNLNNLNTCIIVLLWNGRAEGRTFCGGLLDCQ